MKLQWSSQELESLINYAADLPDAVKIQVYNYNGNVLPYMEVKSANGANAKYVFNIDEYTITMFGAKINASVAWETVFLIQGIGNVSVEFAIDNGVFKLFINGKEHVIPTVMSGEIQNFETDIVIMSTVEAYIVPTGTATSPSLPARIYPLFIGNPPPIPGPAPIDGTFNAAVVKMGTTEFSEKFEYEDGTIIVQGKVTSTYEWASTRYESVYFVQDLKIFYDTDLSPKHTLFKRPLGLAIVPTCGYYSTFIGGNTTPKISTYVFTDKDFIGVEKFKLNEHWVVGDYSISMEVSFAGSAEIFINSKSMGNVQSAQNGQTITFAIPKEMYLGKDVNFKAFPYDQYE